MGWTYEIEGYGVVAYANDISDTAGGTWSEQGGGTIAQSTDVFLVGSSCISGKYAGKSGLQAYDLGSGNELDFTASTGSEAGELLYLWVSMTALGTLDTLSTYPLCIRLAYGAASTADTDDYMDFLIAGNDDKNGWTGGWKCFVIDPLKTPSRSDTSSYTLAQIRAHVRTIGVWIDCSGSARADSLFTDMIICGKGLRVYDNATAATTTTGWKDITDYCSDYANRGWGVLQQREGIYYAYGKVYIGDASQQGATVSFSDTSRVIQFGTSEYCTDAAGTWASSMPTDASGIVIEDHSSYTTTFNDGTVVGTEDGRSGSTIIGNSLMDVSLDFYGGNNAASVTTLHGTTITDCTGPINS
ncbi:MAG: hypothetical protein DRP42_05160, partial [Tenericutes bacterium]